MKKILYVFLLLTAVLLTGCDPKVDEKDPTDVRNPTDDIDPVIITNPLEGIDESLILSMDDVFEGRFTGDLLSYYFYLPLDIEFAISVDAEFDSLIVIKDFITNKIVFEGDDSIFSDDIDTVISLNAGEYTLEISSYDDTSGSFSISLGGNSKFLPVIVGQELSSTLIDEEVYGYLLEIEDASYYKITSSSDFDMEGTITSIEGEFLSYGNDISDVNENFEMIVYLEQGTYIIGVVGIGVSGTGTFQLFVEPITISHQKSIIVNTSISDILLSGEKNVVEFVVESNGYVSLYADSMFDTVGTIYDSSNNIVEENDDANDDVFDFGISVYLESGTYTIEISGYSDLDFGYYDLYYNFTENEVVLPNGLLQGTLASDGVNTVSFTLEQGGYINAYLESSFDSQGTLFNSGRELLLYNDDKSEYVTDFILTGIYLNPGTYEIDITGFNSNEYGNYVLYLDVLYSNMSNALPLTFPGELVGTLTDGGYQWYEMELTEDGMVTAYLNSDFNSFGYLLDEYGAFLTTDDNTWDSSNFYFTWYLQPGTYYIVVSGYNETEYGDYTLMVEFSPYLG